MSLPMEGPMQEKLVFCDPENLEADYIEEFLETKRVPQNLFYLLNGAASFYTYRNTDISQIDWNSEYRFFKQQPFWSPDQHVVFISLGCGNAGPERTLLRQIAAEGHDIDYVGVDSSQAMLDLAAENLQDESFDQAFVLGDFSDPEFRDQLWQLVAGYDVRIYAMIGGTMGNFDQAWIARVLTSLLCDGDYLYLDVVPLYPDDQDNAQLRARFAQLPTNLRLFFDRLLDGLGLSRDMGRIISVESCDDQVGTICYTFYFESDEPLIFSCTGREIELLPEERIELLSIRAYDVTSLKAFLDEHGFHFIDTYVPDVGNLGHLWQRLLFKKQISPTTG